MTADEIGPLLREAYEGDAGCPDPAELLAALQGELSGSDAERLRRHAEGCPRCAGELELARAFAEAPATAEPGSPVGELVASLERSHFERSKSASRRRSWRVPGLAAAAVLAIAVLGVVVLERDGAPRLPALGSDTTTRGDRVEIVAPWGELADLPHFFEWEASQGAARYRVRVLRVDDSVVFEANVDSTRIELPADVRESMHRAVVYFWRVEALDERGQRTGTSERVRFRAALSR